MMRKVRYILGWVLVTLISGLMLFAGMGKVFGFAADVIKQMESAGLGDKVRLIGAGELLTGLLFLLPGTTSLGILLASSFWGGAILLHMTKGEPFVVQSILLLVTWVGAWLRNPDVLWSFRKERTPQSVVKQVE